ncbi:MAG: hypothetical protein JNL11_19420 [Bdellovibrionaceae bacterium]|nr:hypothetical protein [Pseudobdellovibrionaceae bacterium]
MYYTLGFKQNIENIIKLISTKETNKFNSLLEIKAALARYIDLVQHQNKISFPIDELPVLVSSLDLKSVLAGAFSVRSHLNDLAQASMIENLHFVDEMKYQQRLHSAICLIESQNIQLASLIKIVFRYTIFGKSSRVHGGSSSNALGVLWLNPTDKWTEQDYCEFLVHEVTHQLLFLDERIHGHYSQYPKISLKENFAFSTILKRSRPLDKVIHSYFVGLNVLNYRKDNGRDENNSYTLHPSIEHLSKGLEDTRNSLTSTHWSLMTNRVEELFGIPYARTI